MKLAFLEMIADQLYAIAWFIDIVTFNVMPNGQFKSENTVRKFACKIHMKVMADILGVK